ncbi:MAG TPA: ABC transporter ATP-binding protein [Elusimicrobiota bacterium]|jgi:subfamily B ATP-binding cassette protein MsbA|nr:ABC transporter ATP-binding protein [Elusimicrobiota bacterium]
MDQLAKFAPYVRPYRGRFIQASIAMGFVALFNGASIYILKPLVDSAFNARDFDILWLAIVGIPLLVLLKTIASYIQNYLMSWIGQRVTQEIREDLFRHLHRLSLDYFSGQKSGEVLARVTNDLSNVQSALQFLPLYLIRDSLTVLVLLGVLFSVNWSFALIALLSIPVSSVVLVIFGKKMRSSSVESQALMGQIYHRFQESLQGMMLIKAFNYEDGAIEKFRKDNHSFFEQMMRYLRATALSGPLMEFFGSLIMSGLIYYGGKLIIAGGMTTGGFFAFIGAFFAAYAPIKNLARSNSELQRGMASGERIFQLLDEKPRIVDAPGAKAFAGLRESIRLENVSFRYPERELWALKGVSLEVRRGETVALVGPSGSGKSTLVQLLLRLYDPAEGRLLFDGEDLRGLTARSVREHLGLVTQETVLFNETIRSNVALGRASATAEEVAAACRVADAAGFIEALPQGYDTPLGDRGLRLSGGQRQRLAIARAVLKDPSVLVLDEATSNLDSTSEAGVQAALERLMKGRTVIVIAHRLSTIQNADRIVVLNQGEVAETGTHRSLLAADGLYRRLYEVQKAEPRAAEAA